MSDSASLWVRLQLPRSRLYCALLSGLALLGSWPLSHSEGIGRVAGESLAIGALLACLLHGLIAAVESLREYKFDIDVLMVIGAVAAAALGQPTEGALLLVLFVLSGALEELAEERTKREISSLIKLMPSEAQRATDPAAWRDAEPEPSAVTWEVCGIQDLAEGDVIRVLKGEVLPVDAVLLSGAASLDQASLTGESILRDAARGEAVFSGTVNAGDAIVVRATRRAGDSSLQKIVHLVTEAQQQRQPMQRVIDRVSQPYAIGVVVVALAIGLVWKLALNRSAYDAIFTSITLLIVCSPCALLIATPTAALAAIARAARAGLMFKGGDAMMRVAAISAIGMDKTGTITEGRPALVAIVAVTDIDVEEVLRVAAALEQESTHPIATAVVSAFVAGGHAGAAVESVRVVTGSGVEGVYGGAPTRLGSARFVVAEGPESGRVRAAMDEAQRQGHVAVAMSVRGGFAVLVFADRERATAAEAVAELKRIGVEPVAMLTGDNGATASAIAQKVGVSMVFSELSPEQKVERVHELRQGGRRPTALVGDGINDAPALAAADASMAIGTIGSGVAMESADVVLLRDDLRLIPWSIGFARRTRRTVLVNVSFSLGAIALMAAIVILGGLSGYRMPLWAGVVGHEGGTLLVVAHSLLLLGAKGLPPAPRRGAR